MKTRNTKCKTPDIRAARGFTLIEVLIVVGIIVILAGIATVVGVQVKRTAAERQTKATLTALDNAMGVFLKDHPDPGGANWFKALQALPETAKIMKDLKCDPIGVKDGYGKYIQYLPPVAAGKPGYFRSFGPDGVPDGAPGMKQDDLFSTGNSAQ